MKTTEYVKLESKHDSKACNKELVKARKQGTNPEPCEGCGKDAPHVDSDGIYLCCDCFDGTRSDVDSIDFSDADWEVELRRSSQALTEVDKGSIAAKGNEALADYIRDLKAENQRFKEALSAIQSHAMSCWPHYHRWYEDTAKKSLTRCRKDQ